jgi:hypothetical protein
LLKRSHRGISSWPRKLELLTVICRIFLTLGVLMKKEINNTLKRNEKAVPFKEVRELARWVERPGEDDGGVGKVAGNESAEP